MKVYLSSLMLFFSFSVSVQAAEIMAGIDLLESLSVDIIQRNEALGVGTAKVDFTDLYKISEKAHDFHRCGGFDFTDETEVSGVFRELQRLEEKNKSYETNLIFPYPQITQKKIITEALKELQSSEIKKWVEFLSAYPTRSHKSSEPNKHVYDLKSKVETMLSASSLDFEVSLVNHTKISQKTLKVRITGSLYPDEVVVLGGHLDSTVGFFSFEKNAPGADDNASGSSNLLESLRVFSQQPAPQRSVEFFWYAGEEGGLIGSNEIAKSYKEHDVNVVSALQLDMTSFPGNGEFIYSSITDFTNAKLRDFLVELNSNYIFGKIIESECGYGCSDHASWHKQGYPALFPAESEFKKSNKKIHTDKDLVGPHLSFEHSLLFSKIALSYIMELSNSRMTF